MNSTAETRLKLGSCVTRPSESRQAGCLCHLGRQDIKHPTSNFQFELGIRRWRRLAQIAFCKQAGWREERSFPGKVKQPLDGFLRKTLSSAASVKSADEFNCGNKDNNRHIFQTAGPCSMDKVQPRPLFRRPAPRGIFPNAAVRCFPDGTVGA